MTLAQFSRRIFDERKRVSSFRSLIALVANVAALVLAVLPLRTAVAVAESEATQATLQLGEARRQERAAQNAAREQGHRRPASCAGSTPRCCRAICPTAQKTMNLWVTEAARDAGLEFQGSQFDWGEVRDSALSRASSRITLQGSYASIRRFLHAVETAEEFVVVESVELVQQVRSGLADRGARGVAHRLDVLSDEAHDMKLLPPPGPERRRQLIRLGDRAARAGRRGLVSMAAGCARRPGVKRSDGQARRRRRTR